MQINAGEAEAATIAPEETTLSPLHLIRRALLLCGVVFIPLIVLPGRTNDAFVVPKVGLLFVIVGLAGAVRLIEAARRRDNSGLLLMSFVAAAVCLPLIFGWLLSPHRDFALFGQYQRFQGLIPQLAFAAFGVLIADTFRARVQPLVDCLVVSATVISIVGLLQMLGVDPLGTFDATRQTTTFSTIGNTNFVGAFLAIALPCALNRWLNGPSTTHRLTGIAATIIVIEGLILTLSEGAGVAAAVGCLVLVGFTRLRRGGVAFKATMLAAASLTLVSPLLVIVAGLAPGLDADTARHRSYWWRQSVDMALERPLTGWGPNVFAIEGSRHRLRQEATELGLEMADDPHSVPLERWVDAGLLGLAGYLAVIGWLIRRALLLQGAAAVPLAAAAAAWFAQSLISIDDPVLRTAFWTLAGGLAASAANPDDRRGQATIAKRLSAGVAAGVMGLGFLWVAASFVGADIKADRANRAFTISDVETGRANLESALELRNEPHYRRMLGERLGLVSLNLGVAGDSMLHEIADVYRYLDDLPDIRGEVAYAELLSARIAFDESLYQPALDRYDRALALDRYNPLLYVGKAQVHLMVRRTDEALAVMQQAPPNSGDFHREVWGTIALAHAAAGDVTAAEEALARAAQAPGRPCRDNLAQELLDVRPGSNARPPRDVDVLNLHLACDGRIFQLFLRLLPDDKIDLYT